MKFAISNCMNPALKVCFKLLMPLFCFLASTSFGQETASDHRIFVHQALKQLPSVFNFLISQEGFTAEIANDLMAEYFMRIQLMLEHHDEYMRIAKDLGYHHAETSAFFPIKIQESDSRKIFRLHPGEPERLAQTTLSPMDPLLINMPLLNELRPGLTELIQLLIHELGHKISADKDQKTVDRLASLVRKHIEPYYSTLDAGNTRHHLLTLPSTNSSLFLPDFENEMVPSFFELITEQADGRTQVRTFELGALIQQSSPFSLLSLPRHQILYPEGSVRNLQSFQVAIEEVQNGQITFSLRSEYRLVENSTGLSPKQKRIHSALEKVYRVGEAPLLVPQINYQDLISPITQEHQVKVDLTSAGYHLQKNRFALDPETFVLKSSLEESKSEFLIKVSISGPVDQLHLHLTDGDSSSFIAPKAVDTKNPHDFTFVVPKDFLQGDQPLATEVIINSSTRSPLEQAIYLSPSQRKSRRVSVEEDFIEIRTASGWKKVSSNEDLLLVKNGKLKLRLRIKKGNELQAQEILGAQLSAAQILKITDSQDQNPLGQVFLAGEDLIDRNQVKVVEGREGQFIIIESDLDAIKFEEPNKKSNRLLFEDSGVVKVFGIQLDFWRQKNAKIIIASKKKPTTSDSKPLNTQNLSCQSLL